MLVTFASIDCGCGFRVVGKDEARNQELFDNHVCHKEPTETRWHESVFGVGGFMIVVVVAIAAVIVLVGGA